MKFFLACSLLFFIRTTVFAGQNNRDLSTPAVRSIFRSGHRRPVFEKRQINKQLSQPVLVDRAIIRNIQIKRGRRQRESAFLTRLLMANQKFSVRRRSASRFKYRNHGMKSMTRSISKTPVHENVNVD